MIEISKYIQQASSLKAIKDLILLRYYRTRPTSLKKKSIHHYLLSKFPELTFSAKRFKGKKILVNTSDISHLIITDEFLFEQLYPIEQCPFIPDLIIDCGAHIGMFSVLAAAHFPETRIETFECNPFNIPYIQKQIAVNQFKTINIHQEAVSIKNGLAFFDHNESSFGGALIKSATDSIEVKTINLKEFIMAHITLSTKLLLKLDVEGEEKFIIPEIIDILPQKTQFYFETHDGKASFQEILGLLKNAHFTVNIIRSVADKYYDVEAIRL